VIRREFDLSEGDAYNRALVNRAERRLKNLSYFKSVRITPEPGSAPDRVILNVELEEMSTGEFSVSGGYSTSDGMMAEVSVAERNLLGRGLYAKGSVQYGQYAKGFTVSLVEPYFLGYRLALGLDIFAKQQSSTSYVSYNSTTIGFSTRLGFALTENLGFQVRYSLYRQSISLPEVYNNCILSAAALVNGGTGVLPNDACFSDGESSLAVRKELAQGPVYTSAIGYSLTYNTLDNNKNPTMGMLLTFNQDFAGVGGDVNYIKNTGDMRAYREIVPDVIGILHLQGGYLTGWGGQEVRMLDHFQMGPSLVRGFASSGIGARDLSQLAYTGSYGDALGGTMYWGASVEFQTPLYFLPKDSGVRVAAFADAGSLWNYVGPTSWSVTGERINGNPDCATWGPNVANPVACGIDNGMYVRTSVGVGLIWDSPFGPLRFDYSFPITKRSYDQVQQFRFGGGTSF
jgi:outer membrane protein insertion porin family